ncbi:hypothetical protein OAL64_01310 [bacterium]|nr:hypothetical protein [bacterium]
MALQLAKSAINCFGLKAVGVRSPSRRAWGRYNVEVLGSLELHRLIDEILDRLGTRVKSVNGKQLDSFMGLVSLERVGHGFGVLSVL